MIYHNNIKFPLILKKLKKRTEPYCTPSPRKETVLLRFPLKNKVAHFENIPTEMAVLIIIYVKIEFNLYYFKKIILIDITLLVPIKIFLICNKMIPQAMLKITEIVKDEILEIIFSDKQLVSKSYTILCERGNEMMKGKIAGFTQRTCLYIGELKKGKYQFQLDEQNITTFEVI